VNDSNGPGAGGEGPTVEPDLPEAMLEDAISFLRRVRPEGPWTLTAIFPERDGRPTQTETFGPETETEALAWLEARSGRMNLYWMVNPALRPLSKKAERADVKEMVALWVDIDPKKERDPTKEQDPAAARANAIARLEVYSPPPSTLIDSGGGVQAFWMLDEPLFIGGDIPAAEDAARYNQQLEIELGGDRCHNLDRVMRLPGTINLPNAGKRAKGRKPRRAELLEYHDDRRYPLAEFAMAVPGPATGSDSTGRVSLERSEVRRLTDTEELDQWNVPGWAKAVIAQGHNPLEPDKWGGDRSRAVFAVACELVRRGVPPELIVGILTDEDLGISGHILAQKRHVEYAWEQVEKATAKVAQQAEDFARDNEGKPFANHQGNIRLALRKLDVGVRFDVFGERGLIEGLDGFGPHLGDAAMTRLWLTIAERFGVKAGKDFFWSVVEDAARRDSFHPVVDYLAGLEWDGVPRIENWLATYMGAARDKYTQHVGAIWLIAGVRRVRQPGCKFDEMVIFESEQGKDKSTALAIMAVREEWFSDDLPLGADAKVVIERTQGRWIVEAAELDGMGKKAVESLKAMLSRRIDRSRMAFGRMPHEAPRQFVVIGTTNGQQYLRDSTGNRRFWPVRVGNVDVEALRRDRDQLWAEAAKREAEGASIRLNRDLWQSAAAEQGKRRLLDPYFVALDEALGDRTGKIRTRDVWRIVGVPVDRRTPQHEQRVGEAMRELGFERKQGRFGGGGPEYAYVRGTKAERLRQIEVDGDERTGWTVIEEKPARPAQKRLEQAGGGDEPY